MKRKKNFSELCNIIHYLYFVNQKISKINIFKICHAHGNGHQFFCHPHESEDPDRFFCHPHESEDPDDFSVILTKVRIQIDNKYRLLFINNVF